jgi:uncharacterized protein
LTSALGRATCRVVALMALAFSVTACPRVAGKPAGPRIIRLSTGVPGAFFSPLGAELASAYANRLPEFSFEVVPSGGALHNLEELQRGSADLGLTHADVTYLAFVGRLDERPVPFDQLRGVAVLQLTVVHVVIRPGFTVSSIADLRGRRVALGPLGSGTAETAKVLLQSFGLSLSDVRGEYLPFLEAAHRITRNEIDAAFVSAGYPAESVQVAARAGAAFVEVSGPVVERLRTDYPFLRVALIPSGTYAGLRRSLHTVGIDTLIACRAGLDESVVYRLTKTFFEVLPELATRLDALRRMDLARAPATPIPLHDGAARYYRERELLR